MSEAVGIVRRWFGERRAVAQARSRAQDAPEAPTVVESSWRGADTTTRDLAVETNVLQEVAVALLDTAEGRRDARWGNRERVEARAFVEATLWEATDARDAGHLRAIVTALLEQATEGGADLSDLVLTVTPPDPDPRLVPHLTIELRAVKA